MGPATRAPDARKDAILSAALELFAEGGLEGTSIEDIRTRSGASIGSIYHHFGSKEGIAAELYADAVAEYQTSSLASLRAATDSADGIRRMVEHFLGWVESNRQLAVLMVCADYAGVREAAVPRVRDLNQVYFAELKAWVSEGVRRGDLPDLPPDIWHAAVLGPAFRFSTLWVEGRTRSSIRRAARILGEAAWGGLAGLR